MSSPAFSPDPVLRPREQVERQIREAILSGRFADGDRLPNEAQLAEQFAVSRTTVREALRSLESGGLIEKLLGASGGSFVRRVDHHAVGIVLGTSLSNVMRLGTINQEEVDRVRMLLEVPAAGIAAEHRSETDIDALDAIVRAERAATLESPSVSQLDINFHSAIAEASGNRVLAALIRALHQVTQPVGARPLTREIAKRTLQQHDTIIAAIRAGDDARAREAMSEHLLYLGSLPLAGRDGAAGANSAAGA